VAQDQIRRDGAFLGDLRKLARDRNEASELNSSAVMGERLAMMRGAMGAGVTRDHRNHGSPNAMRDGGGVDRGARHLVGGRAKTVRHR
jgi:hypothetical protein